MDCVTLFCPLRRILSRPAGNAVFAAFAILKAIEAQNLGIARERRLQVRIGLDFGDVIHHGHIDIYGRHVNIAARLLGVAQPGEIVATADLRDQLSSELDAEFEDIGACHLRNVEAPIHAYRVHPVGAFSRIMPVIRHEDLLPTIAVIPLITRNRSRDNFALGEVLAENLIVALSTSAEVNVISRLSSSGFRMRRASLAEIGSALNADFVLSGTYSGHENMVVDLELAEVGTSRVIWANHLQSHINELMADASATLELAHSIHRAICAAEVSRAMENPMPTLEGHSLLIGAVTLMHRLSARDFNFARDLLETLIERSPNLPSPRAWMARWHVLRVQQGWTESPKTEGQIALQNTKRALDIDPTNVPALIAEGSVLTSLLHLLDDAQDRYDAALEYSPNDATARLLRGTLNAFRGDGDLAVRDAERALHLAPRDPNRYYFLSLAASACIAAGDNRRALELAEHSLRANRIHTSTLRVKTVAQMRLGDTTGAQKTVRQLLDLEPDLTITSWMERSPSAQFDVGRYFADTMRQAGVPS